MKKLIGITMAAALAFSTAVTASADGNITVNGKNIDKTYIENGGVKMIPLRAVCESLGFTVDWDGEAREIEISKLPMYITCSPDKDGYTFEKITCSPDKDGYTFAKTAPQLLGTAPVLKDGTTYVPVSFISEIMEGSVENGDDLKISLSDVAVEPENAAASVYITEINKEAKSITVEDFDLGTVCVNITDETEIIDSKGEKLSFDALTDERQIKITYNDAMTASLPPITNAVKIEVTDEIPQDIISGTVAEILNENEKIAQIEIEKDGRKTVLNISDETEIKTIDGSALKAENIKKDDVLRVMTTGISTMSIPPQMTAIKITVGAAAEAKPVAVAC